MHMVADTHQIKRAQMYSINLHFHQSREVQSREVHHVVQFWCHVRGRVTNLFYAICNRIILWHCALLQSLTVTIII